MFMIFRPSGYVHDPQKPLFLTLGGSSYLKQSKKIHFRKYYFWGIQEETKESKCSKFVVFGN